MFAKVFAFFALLAVAFAAPEPKPQLLTYPAAAVAPLTYSAYSAPVAYASPYTAAAAYPYAYSGAYYVR